MKKNTEVDGYIAHVMNAAATQCRNCEAPLAGARRFCAACGQRVIDGRLTMRHIGHDIVYVLTHADNSVFALMRSLATRPGYVARDYIEGKRKSYIGPVAALVITVGIAGLLTLIFGMQWFAQVDEVPARYVLQEHMNVVIMFQVPLLALLCWLFFWKERLHYAEHLVFAAYTAAFRVLVSGLRRRFRCCGCRGLTTVSFDSLRRVRGLAGQLLRIGGLAVLSAANRAVVSRQGGLRGRRELAQICTIFGLYPFSSHSLQCRIPDGLRRISQTYRILSTCP